MYTYAIVGSGIIGLVLASRLKEKYPNAKILIIEKEADVAMHASGRNSGVLHAGFYYTADSLKAKFCIEGNRRMKAFCKANHIPVNECGKLVVATNEAELQQLYELKKRGDINGSEVILLSEAEAKKIEPNVKTHKKALWSPHTASVDPVKVCHTLKSQLIDVGVEFRFSESFRSYSDHTLTTSKSSYHVSFLINAAGMYADKIAKQFGLAKMYTIIPFKGVYLKCAKPETTSTNIYPVPNLKNPFLGVHFTKTVTGDVKIGPTATPALWRENYQGFSNFKLSEFLEIVYYELKLFITNAFNFRHLALDELKKYHKPYLVGLAKLLVEETSVSDYPKYIQPGIRAQLLNKESSELVQDFIIKPHSNTLHILNVISPGFTCSFSFCDYILEHYI